MDKQRPPGTKLSAYQEDMKFLRMIDQEDRTVQRIYNSPDGKHNPSRGLEFQDKERARGTPFATHEDIPASRFHKQNMGTKVARLRLPASRPQTGSSQASARSTSSFSSRSSRSTSRTFRSTGASSLFSLNSSASNMTQIAMERIDKLERELEEQRRQREEAQKEMEVLRKIVEENSARNP
eukprot:INCI19849.1.p1 GENE.INCI19849.1~~INCI19849.1.p1  ORF type:complete len:181 (+),score=21.96 INCI19849.1:246-788(+)